MRVAVGDRDVKGLAAPSVLFTMTRVEHCSHPALFVSFKRDIRKSLPWIPSGFEGVTPRGSPFLAAIPNRQHCVLSNNESARQSVPADPVDIIVAVPYPPGSKVQSP